MALLGKIRNQFGWVMMGLVFLGVGGFLFMDVSSVGRGGSGAQQRTVATINGYDLQREEFEQYTKDYEGRGLSSEEMRSYAWDEALNNVIYTQQTKKLGLSVSDKELEDLFTGENISPVVRQQYMDPSTGQIDRAMIKQQRDIFYSGDINSYPAEQRDRVIEFKENWAVLERKVAADRLSAKYLAMVQKGVYAPGWLTTMEYVRNSRTYDFNFVRVLYVDIPNSEANVSDDELKAYLKENAKAYQTEASATIDYVTFDVVATAKDSLAYREKLSKLAVDFEKTSNDTTFVENNRGQLDYKFYTKEDIQEPESVKDTFFAAAVGTVVGPYLDNAGNYKIAKILETKTLPDSVSCRHILQRASARDMNALQQSYALLDSLRKLIVSGEANFDSLCLAHSMDVTNEKGGKMGFRGKGDPYGPNFENYIFYVGKKDSFEIIQSSEGLHLIQITGYQYKSNQKGVRLGTITEMIVPSSETVDAVSGKANEFLANNRTIEDFQKNAKANPVLKYNTAAGLSIHGFEVPSLVKGSTAAEIIRWAHKDAKAGEVAKVIYAINDDQGNYTKQFVVPALVSKTKKGLASIEDNNVRVEIERIVRNQKKAELVRTKLKGVASLEDAAAKYNGKVEMASSVSYSSPYINEVGVEPKLVAFADLLELGKVSPVIEGNQGVYLIQVINKKDGAPMADIKTARRQVAGRMYQSAGQAIFEALKEKANIKDNRANIF